MVTIEKLNLTAWPVGTTDPTESIHLPPAPDTSPLSPKTDQLAPWTVSSLGQRPSHAHKEKRTDGRFRHHLDVSEAVEVFPNQTQVSVNR